MGRESRLYRRKYLHVPKALTALRGLDARSTPERRLDKSLRACCVSRDVLKLGPRAYATKQRALGHVSRQPGSNSGGAAALKRRQRQRLLRISL
jgi:hypothetical protein